MVLTYTFARTRFLLLMLASWFAQQAAAQQFDLVINNGRLIDPASNTDAIRSIGVKGARIAAISDQPLSGTTTIDAHGLVISPGFIDLHSHGQTPENYAFKARDGVTTALEMEVGVWPVPAWYAAREAKALVNFGATSGYLPALMSVMHDSGTLLPRDAAANNAPTAEQWNEALDDVRQGIADGALGIGAGIAYTPKVSREQILDLFRIGGEHKMCLYVHMRNGGPVEPGVIDALQEVIADTAATGASLHVVHITSMGLRQTRLCLEMIEGAHKHGLDVTTEAYPYTAGMTDIASAIFAEGWQGRQGGITYHDLQWASTGERLTPQSFARYRKEGGMVAVHSIPESVVKLAMADPFVMISSDGILNHGKGHPRAAGSYARLLGRYVREEHVVTLMEAIRKMSYEPAERLGDKHKGRIEVGADADITVFDPEHVIDRATYENPAQYSEGIPYVVVGGTLVVKDSQIQSGVFPGIGIRHLDRPGF